MDRLVSNSVAQPRLNLSLLVAFAVLALVLAAVGVYGVMACAVTHAAIQHPNGARCVSRGHPNHDERLRQPMDESKRAAHGKVVSLVLPSKVA
jgi:hypothetical protein